MGFPHRPAPPSPPFPPPAPPPGGTVWDQERRVHVGHPHQQRGVGPSDRTPLRGRRQQPGAAERHPGVGVAWRDRPTPRPPHVHAARDGGVRGGFRHEQPQQAASGAQRWRRAGGVRLRVPGSLLTQEPDPRGARGLLLRHQGREVVCGQRRGGRHRGGSPVLLQGEGAQPPPQRPAGLPGEDKTSNSSFFFTSTSLSLPVSLHFRLYRG